MCKIEENIAKCNNCGNLWIDTNPQVGQKLFEIELNSLEPLIDHNCPKCKTDGYLIDFEAELEIDYSHTVESIEVWKYIEKPKN